VWPAPPRVVGRHCRLYVYVVSDLLSVSFIFGAGSLWCAGVFPNYLVPVHFCILVVECVCVSAWVDVCHCSVVAEGLCIEWFASLVCCMSNGASKCCDDGARLSDYGFRLRVWFPCFCVWYELVGVVGCFVLCTPLSLGCYGGRTLWPGVYRVASVISRVDSCVISGKLCLPEECLVVFVEPW